MKARHLSFLILAVVVVSIGLVAAKYLMPARRTLPASAPEPTTIVQIPNVDDLVYVSTAGNDVTCHRANCARLPTGGRPIVLRDAIKQGYKLCAVCLEKELKGQTKP